MRRAIATIVIAAVLSLLFVLPPAKAGAGTVRLTCQEKAIVVLVNKQRTRRGLKPLRVRPSLSRAARLHSRDMARLQYFSHTSRNGRSPGQRMRAAGYTVSGCRRWSVGENIAWASAGCADARAIVRGWMKSPAHRRIILTRSFRDVGMGTARGAVTSVDGTVIGNVTFYTLDVGRRVLR